MTLCPKCGSTTIVGPRYFRGRFWPIEVLTYTCAVCGYVKNEPTKDASLAESHDR